MRKEASKSLITIGHNYNETTEGRACIYPRHHMVCLDTWEERGKPGVIHNMVGEQVGEQVESTAKQGGRIYTTEDFTGILKPLNLNNIKDIAQ